MMKLDKEKIALRFQIMESGGAIDFEPKNPRDIPTRDLIRSSGKVLQDQLRKGNFTLLFTVVNTDPEFVAETKSNNIGFSVIDNADGIRLDIASSSQQSRSAVHEFIRRARGNIPFTAEEKRMNHPGNNLGRDAPPAGPGN